MRRAASVHAWRAAAAAVVCTAVAAGVAAAALLPDPGGPPADPVQARALRDLDGFVAWLRRGDAQGYVGEVGWPARTKEEGEAWNAVAEAWYERADDARLWVTAWVTGTRFDPGYPLTIYRDGPGGIVPSAQADVVERHPSRPGVLRGVVVAGGEFGTSTPDFSNANPGRYGAAYGYDPPRAFAYLASRGVRLVRVPFRWERVQPVLGGELDATEVDRIRQAVASATTVGMSVVLDLHNFGEYKTQGGTERLGADIGVSTFADVWRRLAIAFRGIPGVVGYGLMNEPAQVQQGSTASPERAWELFSQAAVTAIRATGDRRVVFVSGYPWSGVHAWGAHHPRPWISDPLGRTRYEAHAYWDADHSGHYARSYEEERATAERVSRERADARSSRQS